MSELPEKCCGRCEWWDGEAVKKFTIKTCVCPIPISVNVLGSKRTFADEGEDCPCFKKREGAARRTLREVW